ncbi:TPA: Orn/Lys/Arg decarboxylase N-terminal domain-containing protein [Haemophilus influenzae]
MKTILIAYKRENSYINELMLSLEQQGYSLIIVDNSEELLTIIRNNARLASVLFTYDIFNEGLTDKIIELNETLPVFLLKDTNDCNANVDYHKIGNHAQFIDCNLYTQTEVISKIQKAIRQYIQSIIPPLTKALFKYVNEDKYTFCTPGHMGGDCIFKITNWYVIL